MGQALKGVTQIGFGMRSSIFRGRHRGSESIAQDGNVDSIVAEFRLRHHFAEAVSVGIAVPMGWIAFDPGGSAPVQRASGFGDVELSTRYALLRPDGFGPRLAFEAALSLPTGVSTIQPTAQRPTLLSIGRGAFGGRARVAYSQFFSKSWGAYAWTGVAAPFTANANGNTFGTAIDGGVGAIIVPTKSWTIAPQVSVVHLSHANEEPLGTIINSGGSWLHAGLIVAWRVADDVSVSMSLRTPVYQNVNGEQITETVTGLVQLGFRFGGDDDGEDEHDEDEHDHGDEDKHDHGDEDKHDHGDEDKRDHRDDDEHDHGEDHDHAQAAGPVAVGDVKDLAVDGATFDANTVAVAGKITIVDFWAKWCGPCKPMTAAMVKLAAEHASIVVRKVEVPNFDSPVAKDHLVGVSGLPIVWIYGADGKRRFVLVQKTPAETVTKIMTLLPAP